MVPRLCFKETSTSVPPNYAKEVFALIDPDTPTCLLDGQPHYSSNSPPFPPFTFHTSNERCYQEREKDGKRTVKTLEKNQEEERKKSKRKRSGQNTQARGREMVWKKTSDFPLSSHKYFDKGLALYQKRKKEKQKWSSQGPDTPGIQWPNSAWGCRVEIATLVWASWHLFSLFFPAAHAPSLSGARNKEQSMWENSLDTTLRKHSFKSL